MISEKITYEDYNGNERTEEFSFHLKEAELMEMEMSINGGLAETINRIVSTSDAPAIMNIFKDLILKSYGVKSIDGRRFEKSEKLREEFAQTEAYSQLFMKLATDADAAAKFVNGIMPAKVQKAAAEQQKMIPKSNN